MHNFNSHAHVERDFKLTLSNDILKNFNSHAHVERDFFSFAPVVRIFISTHTLTWSVTYSGFTAGTKYQDFNSHAHVERDLQNL